MKLKVRLRRLMMFGILLKVVISGLLLGIFWELKRNADILSPAHQAAFNTMQQSIFRLEDKMISYAQPSKVVLQKDETLAKNMGAMKLVYHVLNKMADGESFDLSPLREFVSSSEWDQLLSAHGKIAGTDEDLRMELNLCLRYMAADNDAQKQPDRTVFDKMVKVEETKDYDRDAKIKLVIANAESSLQRSHYDVALAYLNDIPGDTPISSCIEGLKTAVQERIVMKNILLSIQRRIIDDK